MTITVLRRATSEQTAIERALEAYDAMYQRVLAMVDQRHQDVVRSIYEEGRADLERLLMRATEDELSEEAQALLDLFITSSGSTDPEQAMAWLDVLPETMERLVVPADSSQAAPEWTVSALEYFRQPHPERSEQIVFRPWPTTRLWRGHLRGVLRRGHPSAV